MELSQAFRYLRIAISVQLSPYSLSSFVIQDEKDALDKLEAFDHVSRGLGKRTLGVAWADCSYPDNETEQDEG